MIRSIAIAATLAGSTLSAGLAFAAGTPTLPNYGHYIGYGTVTVASGCADSVVVGQTFQNQLELNTPGEKLVVLIRQVTPGTAPDFVPQVVKTRLEKSGGTHLSPSGNVFVTDEVGGGTADGTYTASYTPLDLNSFLANISTTIGGCSMTVETAYIRSSAD